METQNVPIGKDKRADRKEPVKYQFDLSVDAKIPATAILLLKCEEKPILLAAAAALAKYAGRSQNNIEELFDLEIVDNVIPIIEHEDLFTRRFAAKLLAQMSAIPCVKNYLLESDYYIGHFTKVLMKDDDSYMQEFSSLILSEISKDMYGAALLLKETLNFDFLFERIQSTDPDVQKNNLEIMYNLLQDPTGAKNIIETENFNMGLIYVLLDSPYPEIQELALKVMNDFVARNKDEFIQSHFRESKGLDALFDFVDNETWQDLHSEAFTILDLAAMNPLTLESFLDMGAVGLIFKYMESSTGTMLFVKAFGLALRLSRILSGRKILYENGVVDYLLQALNANAEQDDMFEVSCRGIGMMTIFESAAKELMEENCLNNILDILKNKNLRWSTKEAALFALNESLKYSTQNCENFLDIEGQNELLWLIEQPQDTVPVEIQIEAVQGIIILAKNESLRDKIITGDTIETICAVFQSSSPSTSELKVACCNALSLICIEKVGRDAFLNVEGPNKLYNLLLDVEPIPIRNTAAQLVQVMCSDPLLASAFISAGYLSYMLNNRSPGRVIPSWNTCIDALFKAHLPNKFALTGRLSLHDVTLDGFYVLRKLSCPFPILEDMFRFKYCPRESIYVVNCISPHESREEEEAAKKPAHGVDESLLASGNLTAMLDKKFGKLHCDPYLYECIEFFKKKLVANEPKNLGGVTNAESGLISIRYVESRAQMLARYVARQMSGTDPTATCVEHQLDIHLKEIRDNIESNLIPLGMLRVGSYLERALLFKVIADKIGLPAALVRGQYGKAWIEIALPCMDLPKKEDSFNTCLQDNSSVDLPEVCGRISTEGSEKLYPCANGNTNKKESNSLDELQDIFPSKLMRPNFIIDLMIVPGDLIPLGSHRAKLYCEQQIIEDRPCCN